MGQTAPAPAVPRALTYLCGRPGGGEASPALPLLPGQSSPSQEGHCGRGQGQADGPWGQAEDGRVDCYSGAWPSRDPSPGSERRRDALGTGASTCYTSHTGHSDCHKGHCFRKQLSAHCLSEPSPAGCHLPSQTTPRKCRARHSHCVSPRTLVAQRTRAGLLATLQGPVCQGKAVPGQAPLTQAKHTPYKEEPPPSYLSWRKLGSSPAGACRAASKQLLSSSPRFCPWPLYFRGPAVSLTFSWTILSQAPNHPRGSEANSSKALTPPTRAGAPPQGGRRRPVSAVGARHLSWSAASPDSTHHGPAAAPAVTTVTTKGPS